jgi:hypothetical protein
MVVPAAEVELKDEAGFANAGRCRDVRDFLMARLQICPKEKDAALHDQTNEMLDRFIIGLRLNFDLKLKSLFLLALVFTASAAMTVLLIALFFADSSRA